MWEEDCTRSGSASDDEENWGAWKRLDQWVKTRNVLGKGKEERGEVSAKKEAQSARQTRGQQNCGDAKTWETGDVLGKVEEERADVYIRGKKRKVQAN